MNERMTERIRTEGFQPGASGKQKHVLGLCCWHELIPPVQSWESGYFHDDEPVQSVHLDLISSKLRGEESWPHV